MSGMDEPLLGVPTDQIVPGLAVMVGYSASAAVNGGPVLICFARVRSVGSQPGTWWLDVYTAPGVVLPQMFREREILGVPALGIEAAYAQ